MKKNKDLLEKKSSKEQIFNLKPGTLKRYHPQ
jgi:hypothetical protein